MHSDFNELLSTLNAHRVKYLVVGAYAVSIYAQPRDALPGASELKNEKPSRVSFAVTCSFAWCFVCYFVWQRLHALRQTHLPWSFRLTDAPFGVPHLRLLILSTWAV
jgi:hypothetical protein